MEKKLVEFKIGYRIPQLNRGNMEEGDVLRYKGKGFLGYDNTDNEMIFIAYDGSFDSWVYYKNIKMLVRTDEIELVS